MKIKTCFFFIPILILCFLQIASAQLSPAERMERCQNNKNRLAELEKQQRVLSAELSKWGSPEEINRAIEDMLYIRKQWSFHANYVPVKGIDDDELAREKENILRAARKYFFDIETCANEQFEKLKSDKKSWVVCFKQLENVIGKKIDAAKTNEEKRAAFAEEKIAVDKQIANHRTNLIALNCDGQAPAGSTGTLRLIGPEILKKSRKDSYNALLYTEYEYTATSAKMTIQNDPPDRKVFSWEFAGIPSSLTPGDVFTITVTGSLKINTPGDMTPASGGVRATGFEVIKEEHAWAGVKEKKDGSYTYRVPLNAKLCTIEIGADYGIGTFARYKYEK